MEQRKDIPAFPLAFQEQDANGMPCTEMYAHDGMTLRDYFAAKAMQKMCSYGDIISGDYETIANAAYCMADAMLAAREKWHGTDNARGKAVIEIAKYNFKGD